MQNGKMHRSRSKIPHTNPVRRIHAVCARYGSNRGAATQVVNMGKVDVERLDMDGMDMGKATMDGIRNIEKVNIGYTHGKDE